MNRTSPDYFPKPVSLGTQAPNPPTSFGIFRPKAGRKLKPRIRVLFIVERFVPTYHQDSLHYRESCGLGVKKAMKLGGEVCEKGL